MKRNTALKGIAATLSVLFLFTACAGKNASSGKTGAEDSGEDIFEITKQDQKTEPDQPQSIKKVDLNACEDRIVFEEAGDIWLSGSLEGQVVVNVEEDELVHLYLAGTEISSPQGPAVQIEEASKIIVTLVSGTENILTDSPDYKGYEERQACLYSACDLTINGSGALQVSGFYKDGIRSRDVVKILGSSVEVQAKDDGVRGNDGVVIKKSRMEIQSEGNGIRTADQGRGTKGVIEIDGASLSVIAGKNGIYAASDLYIRDSVYSVNAVEEKIRADGIAAGPGL